MTILERKLRTLLAEAHALERALATGITPDVPRGLLAALTRAGRLLGEVAVHPPTPLHQETVP